MAPASPAPSEVVDKASPNVFPLGAAKISRARGEKSTRSPRDRESHGGAHARGLNRVVLVIGGHGGGTPYAGDMSVTPQAAYDQAPSTGHPVADLLLNPALWWVLAVLWVGKAFHERHVTRPVAKEYDKRRGPRPGDLFADGSLATSKLEKGIRATIEEAGYRLYPPSTRVYTHKDNEGENHLYTPDIMFKRQKMVIEVDPKFWHGDPHRVAHDIDRNRAYAKLGYTIVRVRIGGAEALSPNDVVLDGPGFDPKRNPKDRTTLLKGIRRARYLPARAWSDSRKYMPRDQNPSGLVPGTNEHTRHQQAAKAAADRAMYPGQEGYLGMPGYQGR